jgi:putative flippase GtrA
MSTALKDLIANSRQAIHVQFGKFLLVGVGNVILTFALYEALLYFMSYMAAFAISAVVGLLYTTLMTIVVTFAGELTTRNIFAQATWYIIYGCIYAACLKLAVDFGIPPALAPFPLLAVLTPLNFLCARFLAKRGSLP